MTKCWFLPNWLGLRATVMKEKLKHMLVERIEQVTRLNVSLEKEREKATASANRYYKWWQEAETKLAEYESAEEALLEKDDAVTDGVEIQVNE